MSEEKSPSHKRRHMANRRVQVIALSNAGKTIKEIATILRVSESRIVTLRRECKDLIAKPRMGRPPARVNY